MRPTWDETWMAVAVEMSRRSKCVMRQVGCVIVSRSNHVAGTGYNGAPRQFPFHVTCKDYGICHGPVEPCVFVHAELNALMFSSRLDREGGTAYLTEMPCESCARALANSGVRRVVVTGLDTASAAYHLLRLSNLLQDDIVRA